MRCAASGRDLPSPRAVTAAVHGPDDTQDSPIFTLMHMSFGQFLAHDNERTAVTQLAAADKGISSWQLPTRIPAALIDTHTIDARFEK